MCTGFVDVCIFPNNIKQKPALQYLHGSLIGKTMIYVQPKLLHVVNCDRLPCLLTHWIAAEAADFPSVDEASLACAF